MSDNLLNKLTQLKLPAMAGSLNGNGKRLRLTTNCRSRKG
ncbi:hypothetical protein SS53G_2766 [Shigella sonnei 53G]|nr:hypothetical protein SS53G_2766 [Shigella sonnei 53G]